MERANNFDQIKYIISKENCNEDSIINFAHSYNKAG